MKRVISDALPFEIGGLSTYLWPSWVFSDRYCSLTIFCHRRLQAYWCNKPLVHRYEHLIRIQNAFRVSEQAASQLLRFTVKSIKNDLYTLIQ